MFIFYILGVGLPGHLMFHQFWLCEEAQCVYLRRHLGSKPLISFLTHSLYNGMLFNLRDFECFGFFPLGLVSSF